MSSDIERWEPPNDSTAFDSLCLDLWKDNSLLDSCTLSCIARPASAKGKAMLKDANKLNSYNEGDLTPGSTP